MRLKRWESPRREGRNDKGKGGSARQRQLKKREKLLRKQLKSNQNKQQRREIIPLFIFVLTRISNLKTIPISRSF
jgi:hypothetical protein